MYKAVIWWVLIQSVCDVFSVWCNTENTSPILWITTHRLIAVYITPQTLKNVNFLYFIIIHSYRMLFYIIICKYNFN